MFFNTLPFLAIFIVFLICYAIVLLVMLAFLLWAGTKQPKEDSKTPSDTIQVNIEDVSNA